jgi:hypothetical protein
MNVPALSFDSTDESRRIRLTRRTAIAGGLAALTGCLGGGSSSGVAGVVVYNPRQEAREVSITVTDGEDPAIETTVTVPGAGSVDLLNRVRMGQTVTATVSDGTHEASTEWDVQGTLYIDFTADGLEFRRESEVDTPRIVRPDGETDIVVRNDDTTADVTVRVDRDGETAFERTRSFPTNTRVAFHDRLDATGSATVTVAVEDGPDITETMSLDGVVTVLAALDDELFLDRNFAGTRTE